MGGAVVRWGGGCGGVGPRGGGGEPLGRAPVALVRGSVADRWRGWTAWSRAGGALPRGSVRLGGGGEPLGRAPVALPRGSVAARLRLGCGSVAGVNRLVAPLALPRGSVADRWRIGCWSILGRRVIEVEQGGGFRPLEKNRLGQGSVIFSLHYRLARGVQASRVDGA